MEFTECLKNGQCNDDSTMNADLVVTNDNDCAKILQKNWKSITVVSACPDIKVWDIIDYPFLQSLRFRAKVPPTVTNDNLYTLQALSMLTIENNPLLVNITVEDALRRSYCLYYPQYTYIRSRFSQYSSKLIFLG